MADKNTKTIGNVPGRYYVDTSCTGCGLCVDSAPAVFALNADNLAAVVKQPSAAEETSAADAKASCPSGSIGDNGAA